MHSNDNNILLDQWERSSMELEHEFKLKSDDLPSILSIKTFFLEIANGKKLSELRQLTQQVNKGSTDTY